MTYQELINEYLDGTLSDAERERQLFDGLAEHPEWREEMALQLRMEQAMQRDLSMVAVPPAATNAIFSRLNFAPSNQASALAQAPTATPLFWRRGPKTLRYLSLFGLPVFMILLSAGGYFLYSNMDRISAASSSQATGQPFGERPILTDSTSTQLEKHSLLHKQPTPIRSIRPAVVATLSPSQSVSQPPSRIEMQTPQEVESQPASISERSAFSYLTVGMFYSVAYLTSKKVIGVFESGKIFCSEDGGHAWVRQSSGTTNDLNGVNFGSDTLNGIAVGSRGTILRTTDAGQHWHTMASPTDANLIAVRYVTVDTVYACGETGSIVRSTNAGTDWNLLSSGTTASFFRMQWENGTEGEVRGANDIRLVTHDAGATWKIVK